MKSFYWLFLLFLVVLITIFALRNEKAFEYSFSREARLGGAPLNLAIVQKYEDLARGFSFHEQIEPHQGLLFVFDSPSRHGIWMKDMKFALDIIWLNEKMEIISIRENFSQESYPEVAYPDAESSFVLEVLSGFVKSNKIRVGDRLEIN